MSDLIKEMGDNSDRAADLSARMASVNPTLQNTFQPDASDGYEFVLVMFSRDADGGGRVDAVLASRPLPIPKIFGDALRMAADHLWDEDTIRREYPPNAPARDVA